MRFLLLSFFLPFYLTVHAETLVSATELARAGAPGLALALLEQQQPDYSEAPQAWLRWHRLRVKVLEQSAAWDEILKTGPELPAGIDPAYRHWLEGRRVNAYLSSNRPEQARALLQRLIWEEQASSAQLRQWRHLVIRSYLSQGLRQDAYAATLRYRHDYRIADSEAQLLHARVFLSSGKVEEARPILRELIQDPEAEALLLLARLRRAGSTDVIRDRAGALLKRKGLPAGVAELLWAVLAEIGEQDADLPLRINALQQLLATANHGRGVQDLFSLDAEALWAAYLNYAEYTANRSRLLKGNDVSWFQAAEQAGRKYPIKHRSLLVWLAHNAGTAAGRDRAHKLLLENLQQHDWGGILAEQLYLHSPRFGKPARLPMPVRYFLAGRAIAEARLELASELMQGLELPPEGTDRFLWQLRRARVFILAGKPQQGIVTLEGLLRTEQGLQASQIDGIVQTLFDLQTVKEYQAAYDLFRQLYLRIDDMQRQRELLYWMGDSRKEQGEYVDAGRLYLQSAILPGPTSMDPWAQTARYQAAGALARAGLTADARVLYQQLLKATSDMARRAVLKRELEQLRLTEQVE